MDRENILKNNYDFIDYEVYRDADHVNRFILEVSKDKHSFFKNIIKNNLSEFFVLENNVLYITDIKKSYAFKLKEDFEIFVEQMYKMNAPVFYISFMVPDCEDLFDFSFIGEVWNIILNGNYLLLYSLHNSRLKPPEHL